MSADSRVGVLRMLKTSIIVMIWAVLIAASSPVHAYDDVATHPDLTRKAANLSSLDTYLLQNFGGSYLLGTASIVDGKKIIDWLTEGSSAEDHPTCRASTHFHNPLLTWTVAGASEAVQTQWCYEYNSPYPGWHQYSALVWATGIETYGGTTTSRNKQTMGWERLSGRV